MCWEKLSFAVPDIPLRLVRILNYNSWSGEVTSVGQLGKNKQDTFDPCPHCVYLGFEGSQGKVVVLCQLHGQLLSLHKVIVTPPHPHPTTTTTTTLLVEQACPQGVVVSQLCSYIPQIFLGSGLHLPLETSKVSPN